MASPLRLRILRLCLDAPLTNKQIAAALGRDPASVLYHVRRLVRTGFLAPEQERRGSRGAREVPYRATGKSWTLDVVDQAQDRATIALVEAFIEDVRRVGPENVEARPARPAAHPGGARGAQPSGSASCSRTSPAGGRTVSRGRSSWACTGTTGRSAKPGAGDHSA